MKLEAVFRVIVERTKERNSLNVVPMKMGDENMSRNRLAIELVAHGLSKDAKAGAAVEDIKAVSNAHLDAGSITSIAHIFRLGSRRGSANSPELNTHTSSCDCWAKLPSSAVPPNPSIHSVVTGGYSRHMHFSYNDAAADSI